MSYRRRQILAVRTENFIPSSMLLPSSTNHFGFGPVKSSKETALYSLMSFRKGSSWGPKLQGSQETDNLSARRESLGKRSRGRLQSWFCRVSSLLKPSEREYHHFPRNSEIQVT